MNWDVIGAIAEMLGALAVIASLVYLSLQIRLNTQSQKSESRLATARTLTQWYTNIMNNPELISIWQAGHLSPEDLSPPQQCRFIWMMSALFSRFDEVYVQFLAGNVDENFWEDYRDTAVSMLENPLVKTWWDSRATLFTRGFIHEIESAPMPKTKWSLQGLADLEKVELSSVATTRQRPTDDPSISADN